MIPISTAVWDPKWFHDGKGPNHVWINNDGVWLGLRAVCLNPFQCHADGCPCSEHNYETCRFLSSYREGLDRLNFNELLKTLTDMANYIKEQSGFSEEPELVLIVYEAEGNPCSERVPLQEYFRKNGIEVSEWRKN